MKTFFLKLQISAFIIFSFEDHDSNINPGPQPDPDRIRIFNLIDTVLISDVRRTLSAALRALRKTGTEVHPQEVLLRRVGRIR
jgi:hypothetical protein